MMNEQILELANEANKDIGYTFKMEEAKQIHELMGKFAELILANADELKRMMNTDPINKPFELNPKFVAKCDEIGRSRRQFQ
jgi:hypothetical protein